MPEQHQGSPSWHRARPLYTYNVHVSYIMEVIQEETELKPDAGGVLSPRPEILQNIEKGLEELLPNFDRVHSVKVEANHHDLIAIGSTS